MTLTKSLVLFTSRPLSCQAKRASSSRSAGDLAPTAGGVISRRGRTIQAIAARDSLDTGHASPSLLENLPKSALAFTGLWRRSRSVPAGKGRKQGGVGG